MNPASRLQDFRIRNKLTTAELALGFGVHERTVRKWEAGDRAMPAPLIVLLDIIEANRHERSMFLIRCRAPL